MKELIKQDFSGKKDTLSFLPQVLKFLQQRIRWKSKLFDPINWHRALLHTVSCVSIYFLFHLKSKL
jgi:hypothetical protein